MFKNNIIFINIFIFLFMLNYLPVDEPVAKGLSILVFVAVLWLSEAIHITITALLVPVMAVCLDVFYFDVALASVASSFLCYFLGGIGISYAFSNQVHVYDQA